MLYILNSTNDIPPLEHRIHIILFYKKLLIRNLDSLEWPKIFQRNFSPQSAKYFLSFLVFNKVLLWHTDELESHKHSNTID